MAKRLTGLSALSYMGVEATTPPQLIQGSRSPTTSDYIGHDIGEIWLVKGTEQIWILVGKAARVANWVLLGGGTQSIIQTDDAADTAIISIPVVSGSMVTSTITLNGIQDDFTDCVGGEIIATAYRPSGGDVLLVGVASINVGKSALALTAGVDANVNVATQTLEVYVHGVVAETWNWMAVVETLYTPNKA